MRLSIVITVVLSLVDVGFVGMLQNPSLTRLIISYFLKQVLNGKLHGTSGAVNIFMFLALSNVPFFKTLIMMNVILEQIYRSGVMLQRSDLSGVSIAFNRDRTKRKNVQTAIIVTSIQP